MCTKGMLVIVLIISTLSGLLGESPPWYFDETVERPEWDLQRSEGGHRWDVELRAESSTSWSYDDIPGWGNFYPKCNNGLSQSPINIVTKDARPLLLSSLIFSNYDVPISLIELHNNGHSVDGLLPPMNSSAPTVRLGLTGPVYKAISFHLHWSTEGDTPGGEHAIDGERYPAEFHLISRNVRYATTEEAIQYEDGLMVLTVFLKKVETADRAYPGIEKILYTVPSVEPYDSRRYINSPIEMKQLLGDLRTSTFYTYKGSLTTPPCAEAVRFVIFPRPLGIPTSLFEGLYNLKDHNNDPITNNFRPLQPLNGRVVSYVNNIL